MTAGQTIDYETLAQEAMRGLVRNILIRTAKTGLPGDHHFFVSFDTGAAGVSLSKRLKEKYPREMTIVLQHRFWDLAVTDDRFEVKLSFDGIPERLVVPFAAIKVFYDPSVRYGLQFDDGASGPGGSPLAGDGFDGDPRSPRPVAVRKSRTPRKPRSERDGMEPSPAAVSQSATAPLARPAAPAAASAANGSQKPVRLEPVASGAKPAAEREGEEKAEGAAAGAQILSLDQFRKK